MTVQLPQLLPILFLFGCSSYPENERRGKNSTHRAWSTAKLGCAVEAITKDSLLHKEKWKYFEEVGPDSSYELRLIIVTGLIARCADEVITKGDK